MAFKKATKKQAKLRLGIDGPSGSGKTFSALSIATNLGDKVAVIDSERGSAAKYSDLFDFDVCEVEGNHSPENYIKLLNEAASAGYEVVVIDSLSHSWNGRGGFLEMVEDLKKRKVADNFTAWRTLTPLYNRLIETILGSPCHVIVTLRSKTEHSMEKDEYGKSRVRKVGMTPEIRENFAYELDVSGSLNMEHELIINKTRCPALDGQVLPKPGKNFTDLVVPWLTDGAVPTERKIPVSDSVDMFQSLNVQFEESKSADDVKKFINDCRQALKDGKITKEQFNTFGPKIKDKQANVS